MQHSDHNQHGTFETSYLDCEFLHRQDISNRLFAQKTKSAQRKSIAIDSSLALLQTRAEKAKKLKFENEIKKICYNKVGTKSKGINFKFHYSYIPELGLLGLIPPIYLSEISD